MINRMLLRALLLSALGCAEPKTSCSTEAVASVTVTARTIDGEVIAAPTGTWTAADGQSGDCEAIASSLVCGWEVEGEIEITLTAEGFEEVTETVQVEADTCHVVGEALDVELRLRVEGEPECPAMASPSVWVTVESSAGGQLTGVDVSYTAVDGDGREYSCPIDSEAWACGAEAPGSIEVTAAADGHEPGSVVVPVDPADCHQTRLEVTLTLEEAAD